MVVYAMLKGLAMQRTQIYFEQDTLQDLKEIAGNLNISVSELIRNVMKKEIKKTKESNLNDFLANMSPIESFKDVDATEYVNNIRSSSRILND
jgi:post-segregation antitoxin (ccd killing protein)